MRKIIGLIGIALVCFATGFLIYNLKTGFCTGIIIIGTGLLIDSLKK